MLERSRSASAAGADLSASAIVPAGRAGGATTEADIDQAVAQLRKGIEAIAQLIGRETALGCAREGIFAEMTL